MNSRRRMQKVIYPSRARVPMKRTITRREGRVRGREVFLVGRNPKNLTARVDLVLCLRREIAGVMALVQLLFSRTAGAVDHSPAIHGRALADLFRPARQVSIFARL